MPDSLSNGLEIGESSTYTHQMHEHKHLLLRRLSIFLFILLSTGPNLLASTPPPTEQLIHALKSGRPQQEIIEAVLKTENVNVADNKGNSLLMLAVENGYRQLVQVLYYQGASVNATDRLGRSILLRVADAGDPHHMLRLLLDLGADPFYVNQTPIGNFLAINAALEREPLWPEAHPNFTRKEGNLSEVMFFHPRLTAEQRQTLVQNADKGFSRMNPKRKEYDRRCWKPHPLFGAPPASLHVRNMPYSSIAKARINSEWKTNIDRYDELLSDLFKIIEEQRLACKTQWAIAPNRTIQEQTPLSCRIKSEELRAVLPLIPNEFRYPYDETMMQCPIGCFF